MTSSMPWRELGNLIWPDVPDSRRGELSTDERQEIRVNALLYATVAAAVTRVACEGYDAEASAGSTAAWVAFLVVLGVMALWGVAHYRRRGGPPPPPAAWKE